MRDKNTRTVIESMFRIKQKVGSSFAQIEGFDMSPSEWMMLNVLYTENNLNSSMLAEKMGVTTSAVSQWLKELEARKYIKRTPDKTDKRSSLISLTPKSKKMLDSMCAATSAAFSDMFSCLSDTEIKTLAKIHSKIADNIK